MSHGRLPSLTTKSVGSIRIGQGLTQKWKNQPSNAAAFQKLLSKKKITTHFISASSKSGRIIQYTTFVTCTTSFSKRKLYCVTDSNTLINCGIHSNQGLSNTKMEKLSVIYCVNKTAFSKKLSSIEHQLPLCNKANVDNCTHNMQSRVRMGRGRGLHPEKMGGAVRRPFLR